MRIAVTGASGLLGTALVAGLTRDGHQVLRVSRRAVAPNDVQWDPSHRQLDLARLQGIDAAVHLAGEPIAARWTTEHKRRVLESRTQGTRLLSESLARLEPPPKVLISASAVGYYGDRGDEVLTEQSPPGHGFLAEVAVAWEDASRPAGQAGIRVVNPRFGLVLTPSGGALGKLLPPFRLGLGGRIGSGRQWMSWIALDDIPGALRHLLLHPTVSGPVNLVAPHPVTNAEFTRTLGRVLSRPTLLAVPAAALRLGLGEMGEELLLQGQRVLPRRLEQTGYQFAYPELDRALRAALAD